MLYSLVLYLWPNSRTVVEKKSRWDKKKEKKQQFPKLLGERRAVSFSSPSHNSVDLGPKMPRGRPECTNGSSSEKGIRH